MAYTTWSDVKSYLDLSQTTTSGDYSIVMDMITQAQSAIEEYTQRKFEHSTVMVTRYYEVNKDTDNEWLYLDEELSKINSIKSDCDGTTVTISSTEYITVPRNTTPYHAIKLLDSTTNSWDYTDDPENGVQVSGAWSYSTVAPDDIKHAAIRLAAYYYRQREAQVFDTVGLLDSGRITVPMGIPQDVKIILDPYRKVI